MDDIFKALGDPTRRQILDALRARDGQTVSELEAISDLTRFGVMKHLGVLEEAGLITSRREGRFRYVHLNPAPLQQVVDRWVEPMLRPWARRMADLKSTLEQETDMNIMAATTTDFRMETFIRTTPDRLWAALTDPADTANYYFGSAVASDWTPGAPITYTWPDGKMMLTGSVEAVDKPRRLVTTFTPHWSETPRTTRVTYEIEPVGEVVKFTIIHEGLTDADSGIKSGWTKIANGLKTWLETGRSLPIPMGA